MIARRLRAGLVAVLLAGTLMVPAPSHLSRAVGSAPNVLQLAWDRWVLTPGLRHATVSALAVDLTTGRTLAAINPDRRVTPASVDKLFTSAAALATLGPSFRYRTTVAMGRDTPPGRPPVLYVIGGGDGWLGMSRAKGLVALAARVAERLHVVARVVGVANAWAPPDVGVGWPIGDLVPAWGAVPSPLTVSLGAVRVRVTPGAAVGRPPVVAVQAEWNGSWVAVPYGLYRVADDATTGPAGGPDTLAVSRAIGGDVLTLSGSIPLQAAPGIWFIAESHPALLAAALFQHQLVADGVRVLGPPTVGTAPAARIPIAVEVSPPLAHLLQLQNQWSLNLLAESVFRWMGRRQGNGSPDAAAARLDAVVTAMGVTGPRVQVDGSGLSPLDETSAEQVVQLLAAMARSPWFSLYEHTLIALNHPGACAFWCSRYPLPPGAAVYIKTGNLANQWNYAGYVHAQNGHLIALAILDDGPPTTANAYPGSSVDNMLRAAALWPDVPLPPGPTWTAPAMPGAVAAFLRRAGLPRDPGAWVAVAGVDPATGRLLFGYHPTLLVHAGLLPRLLLAEAYWMDPPNLAPLRLLAEGTLHDGILQGNLVVEAGGDPLLSPATLTTLASAVRRDGIRVVRGGIRYVTPVTGWTGARWPSDVPWNDIGQAWAPPEADFALNGGVATLEIGGSPSGGSTLPLDVHPGSDTAVTVVPNLARGQLTIVGTVRAHQVASVAYAPLNPGQRAATTFETILRQAGVTVNGPTAPIPTPVGRVVAAVPGPSPVAVTRAALAGSGGAAWWLLRHLTPAGRDWLQTFVADSGASIGDWQGLGLENYVEPLAVADALIQWPPAARGAAVFEGRSLWIGESPEVTTAVGTVPWGRSGRALVVAVESEESWSGSFAVSGMFRTRAP